MHESKEFEKFLLLDAEKRERIITAAANEFVHGFKKASTDNIVREAGISKGLLFHYFGTKERLYNFLIDHAVKILKQEYIDLINERQPDILDSIWQTSLLKQDLAVKHPGLFDFLTAAYVHETKGGAPSENLRRFVKMQQDAMQKVYANANKELFRDDICPQEVMNIITWTMQGFASAKVAEQSGENPGALARENYERYLEELQKTLNTLRKCFYREALK